MKLTIATTLLAAGLGVAASAWAQPTPAAKPAGTASSAATSSELKTQKEKASYALGMNIGENLSKGLERDGIELDHAMFLRGMKDALAGDKLLLTDEEAKSVFTAYQKEVKEKQEAKMKVIGEQNKKDGEAFLAANKSKEGVITLPSGLQYKIEKQGDGPKPTATDTVECNYRGTLIDGKEFDSSYKRGKSASFPVVGVIKGWTEVLQLMPVGSKYQVFIPAELAYGARGAGADIGPDSTLIFEIELLSIKAKPAAATPAPKPASPAAAPAKPAGPAK
ncbi:MAG: FKBP-type peptidyl-prolyl cis-trans isomerase [Candidatus Korobacteraceae bacterium]